MSKLTHITAFIISIFLFSHISCTQVKESTQKDFFPGENPGKAEISLNKNEILLSNNAIQTIWKKEDNLLIFYITANRFLRNMVRAIVGTLLDVGTGNKTIEEFKLIIESKNRSKAGASAKAKGLFLTKIEYPFNIKK